ncbi:LPP20 family lipoprotein [Desulfurobacterium atlanticum]|uniref:LPP20 lipoprotein n=1 Tax=Desulfurobacterium atlanticum TaxID=240169 RepID=A0A238YWW2_9BACT|nr:LPP20 family lipoprotein [Desulfurobacterium atlanticum]SNR75560.1 LPP20 lipoprotein [Desulfurobacterium atlanticum]
MKVRKVLAAAMVGLIAVVAGCGGGKPTPKTTVEVSFPWDDYCNKYSNIEGGLAVCKCNFAMDIEEAQIAREESVADARSELARLLEVKVMTMVKRYKNRTVAGKKRYMGSTFEEVAKQVAKQYLRGTRVINSKTFRADDGRYVVCAVVALQPHTVKQMIKEMAQKMELSPRDEDILYQEFKAYKAQQELEKEMQKY